MKKLTIFLGMLLFFSIAFAQESSTSVQTIASVSVVRAQEGTSTTETTTTTSTIPTTTTTISTCTISASPDPNFVNMNPGDTSSTDVSTTITNSGNTAVTPTIKGSDWGATFMDVGQTHWSTTSGTSYYSMTALTTGEVSLNKQVSSETPLPVYFKLSIPAGQTPAQYSQTITFTAGCD